MHDVMVVVHEDFHPAGRTERGLTCAHPSPKHEGWARVSRRLPRTTKSIDGFVLLPYRV